MRVTYSLEVVARCPSDRLPDRYDVKIESERTILAEDIVAYTKTFGDPKAKKHLSQEEITEALHRRFAARVTTVGYHYGVRAEVISG